MDEKEWAGSVLKLIQGRLKEPNLAISQGSKLPYGSEVLAYTGSEPNKHNTISYETDLLILEQLEADIWKPRVVVEIKLGKITTHDAITYSEKARTHKNVHPYLRYGILIGNRQHYPLPGRLFRHGAYFDFMQSWTSGRPSAIELNDFMAMLFDEVEASRNLEEILYNSRNPNRKRYTLLHRPLRLK